MSPTFVIKSMNVQKTKIYVLQTVTVSIIVKKNQNAFVTMVSMAMALNVWILTNVKSQNPALKMQHVQTRLAHLNAIVIQNLKWSVMNVLKKLNAILTLNVQMAKFVRIGHVRQNVREMSAKMNVLQTNVGS